jgi:choline dehydrogenase-like flavoprotein
LPTRDTGLIFRGDEIVGRDPPVHNMKTFLKLRKLAVDLFRRAGYVVLARRQAPRVWHEVGTARFGTDPATSVVDPNCQVHGIEGLFVVDASVLPSAGAVNTALTIISVALRAGDYISRQVLGRESTGENSGVGRSSTQTPSFVPAVGRVAGIPGQCVKR